MRLCLRKTSQAVSVRLGMRYAVVSHGTLYRSIELMPVLRRVHGDYPRLFRRDGAFVVLGSAVKVHRRGKFFCRIMVKRKRLAALRLFAEQSFLFGFGTRHLRMGEELDVVLHGSLAVLDVRLCVNRFRFRDGNRAGASVLAVLKHKDIDVDSLPLGEIYAVTSCHGLVMPILKVHDNRKSCRPLVILALKFIAGNDACFRIRIFLELHNASVARLD